MLVLTWVLFWMALGALLGIVVTALIRWLR